MFSDPPICYKAWMRCEYLTTLLDNQEVQIPQVWINYLIIMDCLTLYMSYIIRLSPVGSVNLCHILVARITIVLISILLILRLGPRDIPFKM